MYQVEQSARIAHLTISGTETIKFSNKFNVFGVKGEDILVSLKNDFEGDGVYNTADGEGYALIPHYKDTDTLYLSGSGDVVVVAGNTPADCSFKSGAKGGGGSGGDNTHYKGTTTTPISNGSTTNPITIDGEEYTAVFGDIVVYGYTEFVFDGTAWSEFGRPFDTTPTSGSANAVTSDGVYKRTPLKRGTGARSVAQDLNSANGTDSVAFGYYTTAGNNMVAIGRFNNVNAGGYFNIGNGIDASHRSNILEANATSVNINGDIQRDGVGIDDYTTTERKIGKWIDGSDLYQRTFEVTGIHNDGTYDDNILGTSDIVIRDWTGYIQYDTGTTKVHYPICGISFSATDWIGCWVTTGLADLAMHAKINTETYTLDKAVVTIKYTKPSAQNLMQTAPTEEVSETPTTVEEDDMR